MSSDSAAIVKAGVSGKKFKAIEMMSPVSDKSITDRNFHNSETTTSITDLGSQKKNDKSKKEGFFAAFTEVKSTFGLKFIGMIIIGMNLNKGLAYNIILQAFTILRRQHGLPASQSAVYGAISRVPFTLKPIIAIMSDLFPIFGYKKKYYMAIFTTLGIFTLTVACVVPKLDIVATTACVFFANLSAASLDILIEGFYSHKLAEHPGSGPGLVTLVWTCMFLVSVISAPLTGTINSFTEITSMDQETQQKQVDGFLGYYGGQWAMMSALPCMIAALYPIYMNWLGEEPVTPQVAASHRSNLLNNQKELVILSLLIGLMSGTKTAVGLLYKGENSVYVNNAVSLVTTFVQLSYAVTFLNPMINKIIVFNFILTAMCLGPTSEVLNYFYVGNEVNFPNGPHFDEEFVNTVIPTAGTLMALAGTMMYGMFCKDMTYRSLYAITAVCMCVFTLVNNVFYTRYNVQLGIPDKVFLLGDEALSEIAYMLNFMPGFLMLSRVCPKNCESTLFAILASIKNGFQDVGYMASAQFMDVLAINPNGKDPNEGSKYDNLPFANIVSGLSRLLPLLFLWMVPPQRQSEPILTRDEDRVSATNGSLYQKCTGKPDKAMTKYHEEQELKKKSANI